ncbi:hypothetical protein [Paenibacillus sp. A3]|uniref:hypothetical protein n=1 Tax=Paenibacillus sp. A3 TaxID=1337054 RepID=UPI001ED99399|nr:hypothetical protein [Paenibacillus sp. A3]
MEELPQEEEEEQQDEFESYPTDFAKAGEVAPNGPKSDKNTWASSPSSQDYARKELI